MRKAAGSLCIFAAVAAGYGFAVFTGAAGDAGPWAPFLGLGRHFPGDVALLLGAPWLAGIGLALMVHQPVGPGGRFAADGRFIPGNHPVFYAATPFLLNALLLISLLFALGVGIYRRHAGPAVPLIATVAALQVACGLILMIMSFFDRPRASGRLAFGTAAYVVSAVVAVAVLVMGKPD